MDVVHAIVDVTVEVFFVFSFENCEGTTAKCNETKQK
jgi:hypothetical protein